MLEWIPLQLLTQYRFDQVRENLLVDLIGGRRSFPHDDSLCLKNACFKELPLLKQEQLTFSFYHIPEEEITALKNNVQLLHLEEVTAY